MTLEAVRTRTSEVIRAADRIVADDRQDKAGDGQSAVLWPYTVIVGMTIVAV